MQIKWGVLLPTFDPLGQGTPPVAAAARCAEQLGFDALWAGDHLISHPPVLDSLCALSAAAAVTSRIELGVGVLQLSNAYLDGSDLRARSLHWAQHLAIRANEAVWVATLSGTRVIVLHHVFRPDNTVQILEVLPALLRGEPVDHPGPLAPVRVPGLRPAVSSLPRLSVGGRSDAALRRAARYGDQWMGIWLGAGTVRSCADRLAALAASCGRPAPSVAMLVLVNVDGDTETARRGAAELVQGQYRMPLEMIERWTAYGPAGTVAGMLREYAEAGVSEFVLMPASGDPLGQYERLAEVRELVRTGSVPLKHQASRSGPDG